jgi:hypothetical protein
MDQLGHVASQDHKGILDLQVSQDHKDRQDPKLSQGPRESPVLKDRQDPKDLQGPKVIKVTLVLRAVLQRLPQL